MHVIQKLLIGVTETWCTGTKYQSLVFDINTFIHSVNFGQLNIIERVLSIPEHETSVMI